MSPIVREINDIKLTFRPDGDPASTTQRRIGSCTLRFADGTRALIRIYGMISDIWTRPERVEFEKELRTVCADDAMVNELFPGKVLTHVRRFNPSEHLISMGWRCVNTHISDSITA